MVKVLSLRLDKIQLIKMIFCEMIYRKLGMRLQYFIISFHFCCSLNVLLGKRLLQEQLFCSFACLELSFFRSYIFIDLFFTGVQSNISIGVDSFFLFSN